MPLKFILYKLVYSKIVKVKWSITSPLCETVIHALRRAISFIASIEYIKFLLFVKDYFRKFVHIA